MESVSYETEPTPVSEGTVQDLLAKNIGRYAVSELLVGLRSMTVREGILIEVGRNYFVLMDPDTGDQTSCDLYSLKFLTIPGKPRLQTGAQRYCPYAYETPSCHRGSGTTACWMRVD